MTAPDRKPARIARALAWCGALPALMARGLIRGYKLGISPLLPPSCRFEPSCSTYALEAIGRFGVARGGWMAVRRLARCHPWGGFGYDPVPDAVSHDCAAPIRTSSSHSCPPLA